ncbi:MAG TPA: hypothetical protein VFQ71_06610, partial [Gaiellales bacterium]|nr:hypothetical protein [Gaiellales bacterium]
MTAPVSTIPPASPVVTQTQATDRRARRRSRGAGVAAGTLLWGYAIVALAPLLLMVASSLRTEHDLADQPLGLPLHPAFENYANAWSEGNFSTYFGN